MGKGKRINNIILKVLRANPNVWMTTKEMGWIMNEMFGFNINGKVISKRVCGFEYDPKITDGRVERLSVGKNEKYLNCRYRYRWKPDEQS